MTKFHQARFSVGGAGSKAYSDNYDKVFNPPIKRYRKLEQDLRTVRNGNSKGSLEEDEILQTMADVWWELTDEEREMLDNEGPTC